jgi:hypothetical protein
MVAGFFLDEPGAGPAGIKNWRFDDVPGRGGNPIILFYISTVCVNGAVHFCLTLFTPHVEAKLSGCQAF